MAKLPEYFTPGWAGDHAIYRKARSVYRCSCGSGCPSVIPVGAAYIEYTGETPAFKRGSPVSLPCALREGYIEGAV